ncbi:MAG: hypothetical protein WCY88_14460 [Spongiibacteraceae bacterium]
MTKLYRHTVLVMDTDMVINTAFLTITQAVTGTVNTTPDLINDN